jgi:hypothetical protein
MTYLLYSVPKNLEKNLVRRDLIIGIRTFTDYFFRRLLLFVGLLFFLVGFSSWKQEPFLEIMDISEIQFVPQGLVICFYGTLAFILGFYLFLRGFWSVGSGFNEYNKVIKQVYIFRWGFPGKNRRLKFFYSFSELAALRLERRSKLTIPNGLNLYLLLKGQRKILLLQLNTINIRSPQEIEYFAANLALFLQIPLEGVA